MAILIDTSVWLAAYRDRSGQIADQVRATRGDADEVFSRFVAMEIFRAASPRRTGHGSTSTFKGRLTLSSATAIGWTQLEFIMMRAVSA